MTKSLPHNLEAEKHILGSILLDNNLMHQVISVVAYDDFFDASHKALYRSMEHLYENGTEITAISVITALKTLGLFNGTTIKDIKEVISDLDKTVPKTSNLSFYVQTVKQHAIERQKIKLVAVIQESLLTGNIDDAEEAESKLTGLRINENVGGLRQVSALGDSPLLGIYKQELSGKRITGVRTGIKELDDATSGLQNGETIIIAARPSVGKTALALTIAQFAALKDNRTVAMFSLEMSFESLYLRLLASLGKVPLGKIKQACLSKMEWARLLHVQDELSKTKIFIDDEAGLTPKRLRAALKEAELKCGHVDLVIIDYLQLMTVGRNTENRQQEVSQISRHMKLLAKEFNTVVVALSQLSRAPEQRNSTKHTPLISDLRESGSLEQDADMVALLYREEMYDPTDENEGIASLILGKHRNGEIKSIPLFYVKDQVRFENIFC